MGRNKKEQPPAGGAVTEPVSNSAVNPMVHKMTGHETEEEMANSLPTNTVTTEAGDDKPARKPRRSKAEMEAGRAKVLSPDAALMEDKRYARAVGKATFFGAPKAVKGGFHLAANMANNPEIELNSGENEDIEDFFYALSKRRAVFDPYATWWTSLLYFLAMIGTLIGTRFVKAQGEDFQKSLAKAFGFGAEPAPEAPEATEPK